MSGKRGGWELPISEDELSRLTEDMGEAHHETLPAMHAGAADLTEQITAGDAAGAAREGTGRRRFLLSAGGAGAAFLLAACSDGTRSSSSSAQTASASPAAVEASPYTGDLKIVALATALENQAIGVYTDALSAAKESKFGNVPPAVATFMTKARSQHADHAKVWNAVLTGAGKPAIKGVPLSNQSDITTALGRATDIGAVAQLALQLENQAAQTYFFATYHVKSVGGIQTAATIAPVEAMHAAILHFVLGQYPVPDTFLPVDQAAEPSLLTV